MVRITQIKDREELVGRLEDESILELISQTLKSNMPIYLWIRYLSEEGHYYFRDGKIIAAACRSLRGKHAAYNCLAFRAGIFRLSKDQKPPAENVEIVWKDFENNYLEEIKKLVISFLPEVDGKFVFRLTDIRHQEFYYYQEPHSRAQTEMIASLFVSGLETGFKLLVRGLEENITEIKDETFATIFFIPELRYFAAAAGESREKDKIISWLRNRFIPLARDAVSVALRKSDRMSRRAGILAVVPDPKLAEEVSSPLSSAGFKVWNCLDGFEGLVRTEDYRPDLIILCSRLERLSALEVYQRLKRKEFSQMIPVICMVSDQDKKQAQAEQCGDIFLDIPFSAKKLVKMVENLLELK